MIKNENKIEKILSSHIEKSEPKYLINTYGCQMNIHDSEKISYLLESLGYTKTEDKDEADFIVFNTCIVRENAELKVYGHIGALKKLKESNKDLIIAICGCMMETDLARETIISSFPQVDIIFGTKNLTILPQLIYKYLSTGETAVDISIQDSIDELIPMNRASNKSAYVNIMTGCNNFCSYCIVPYARGREESRTKKSILKEVLDLDNQGYKEVILLGQNVNSYGLDKRDKGRYPTFPDLLKEINDSVRSIERIRFLTSHPKDISDELIQAISQLNRVSNYIHLPFQSGSNKVLKEMNRKYTREEYLLKCQKIKDLNPGIVFSTDIMVGFPGESEEDFQETLDLVKQVGFEQAFTFIYSKRPETKAAKMLNQVPDQVKQDRFERLLDVVYDIFYKKNRSYLGSIQEVLVEGPSKNNPEVLTGRSDGYKIVNFLGGTDKDIGKIIKVEITDHNSFALKGIKRC